MGVLIEGKWRGSEMPQEAGQFSQFKRVDGAFRERLTANSSSGFRPNRAAIT